MMNPTLSLTFFTPRIAKQDNGCARTSGGVLNGLGRPTTSPRGAILIMVLVALALLAALGGTLLRWASMEHKLLRSQAEAGQARWLAEAGVERAAARLAHDLKYAGETWDIAAADLPAGAAARVRIVVKPLAGHADRSSIVVDVEYPLESDVASRVHKEAVFPIQAEET